MPGVKVVGKPMPKGSVHCVGPRTAKCKGCGHEQVVIHNVQPDDSSGEGKEWRKRLVAAGQSLRRSIGYTFEGPVSVDATFVIERPKTIQHRVFPHKYPDLDKLVRMLLDALTTAGVWLDDSLVCELNVRKQYPGMIPELTGPGVVVRVDLMVDPDALPIEGGQ